MKNFLFAIIIFFSTGLLFSQQFYVKVQGGYGIGTSPREHETYRETQRGGQSGYINENKTFSFGEGLNIGTVIGYNIQPNFGCELEIQYSKSAELNLEHIESHSTYYYQSLTKSYSNTFYFNPSFILMMEFSSFKPYLKIGPSFALPEITYGFSSGSHDGGYSESIETEYLYNGGIAIGVNSAAGITWKANDGLNFNFEISSKNISYSPTKRKLEKAIRNGVNVIESFTKSERETDLVDSITEPSSYNPDKPGKSLKTEYPFNSISFSVGISIML